MLMKHIYLLLFNRLKDKIITYFCNLVVFCYLNSSVLSYFISFTCSFSFLVLLLNSSLMKWYYVRDGFLQDFSSGFFQGGKNWQTLRVYVYVYSLVPSQIIYTYIINKKRVLLNTYSSLLNKVTCVFKKNSYRWEAPFETLARGPKSGNLALETR